MPSPSTKAVRRAVETDVDALTELNAFVQALHAEHRPDVFLPPDGEAAAAWFRGVLNAPNVRVWVVEHEHAVVGYALTNDHDRQANAFVRASRWLELDQIGVHPLHQNAGVGHALFRHVVEDARSRHMQRIAVQSWSFNERAHAAFQRWGFTPRTSYFSLELTYRTTDRMRADPQRVSD